MTAGLTGATISFDFDVDPKKRTETPDFYGYIPDGKSRSLIFICMLLNGTLLLLVRSFSAALLMLIDTRYVLLYHAFDMGMYFLQKIARRDFWYWFPIDGATGLVVSAFMRVVVKVVTDYTGIIQFRGGPELGGLFWSINMLIAMMTPFAAIKIYFETDFDKVDLEAETNALEAETAWLMASLLSGAWMITFGLFFVLMKKKYRRSFYSLATGNDYAQNYFLRGRTDEEKAVVFTINKIKWKAIEGDVKVWLLEGWERWEEEEPDWFTEVWKSRVPDNLLPAAELRRQKMAGGGQRRRSSLIDIVGGSTQERRGSATVAPAPELEEADTFISSSP